MSNNHDIQSEIEKRATQRHYLRVVAFVVFSVSLGAYLMTWAYPRLMLFAPPQAPENMVVTRDVSLEGLTREFPTELSIPSLNISTTFEEPLILDASGTIMVPEGNDTVGWYKLGAAPGERGTASILGHVDSKQGPAVFYSLGRLVPGDLIHVTRADGSVATFAVEYLERYKQSDFPTEKVYGMTEEPTLRLITCSGIYERGEARYTHNLVVYARFIGALAHD
jgi:sortase (surface protein transpeptidase)